MRRSGAPHGVSEEKVLVDLKEVVDGKLGRVNCIKNMTMARLNGKTPQLPIRYAPMTKSESGVNELPPGLIWSE